MLKASNETGLLYFMLLHTNKRMHRYILDELPIDHEVIRRVEELATDKYHTMIDNRHPIFEWSQWNETIDK